MKKLAFTLILLGSLFLVKSQPFNIKDYEIKSDSDLLKTTTWLVGENSTKEKVLGTGYLFYSKKKNELFLVTNQHVVENEKTLVFGCLCPDRYTTVTIYDIQNKIKYYKDSSQDLAIIRIDTLDGFQIAIFKNYKFFTEDNFLSKTDSSSISIFDNTIISLGFPGLTVIPFPFRPYIYHCNFAVPFNSKFRDNDDLVLEGNLQGGCSGSPVILIQNHNNKKKYSLLGTYYFSVEEYKPIDSITLDTINWFYNPIIEKEVYVEGHKKTLENYMIKKSKNIGFAVRSKYLLELINE